MSDKDWSDYLNTVQLSYFPVTLACIGVLLVLSAFRDLVFADFQLPMWLNALNGLGIAIVAVAGLLTAFKQVKANFADVMLFLSIIVLCIKPSIIVFIDNSPGTLVLATVIFAAGLIFLSLRFLIMMQALTLLVWLSVTYESFGTLQYFATFIVAVVSGSLGMWLQQTRLDQLHRNYDLANRVQELETIVPMCANCKKTRDESGAWLSIEEFLEAQGDSQVSHGICPECKESLYGELLKS